MWKFIADEIFELLDSNGITEGNLDGLEGLVSVFVTKLSSRYSPEDGCSESGLDTEFDTYEPLDIDPEYDY